MFFFTAGGCWTLRARIYFLTLQSVLYLPIQYKNVRLQSKGGF